MRGTALLRSLRSRAGRLSRAKGTTKPQGESRPRTLPILEFAFSQANGSVVPPLFDRALGGSTTTQGRSPVTHGRSGSRRLRTWSHASLNVT